MKEKKRRRLVEKLEQIRETAHNLQRRPSPESNYGQHSTGVEDIIRIDIKDTYDRLSAVLQRFGLKKEASRVDNMLAEREEEDFLFIIQEPPPWEGDYLVLRQLVNFVEQLIFAYSDEPVWTDTTMPANYRFLLQLLCGLENSFTVTNEYPETESEVHTLAESVLKCAFPRMIHEPSIGGTLKSFRPDTGIPETQTLIEYKYIDAKSKVPKTVDELFADAIGYVDDKWNNLICVIYETEHFSTIEGWREEAKKLPRAEIILIRGSTSN